MPNPQDRPSEEHREYLELVGSFLREARERAAFSQAGVAAAIGISQSTYAGIERGTAYTSFRRYCDLADLFSLKLDDLLGLKFRDTFDKAGEANDNRPKGTVVSLTLDRHGKRTAVVEVEVEDAEGGWVLGRKVTL